MRIQVLGPLRVWHGDEEVDLGPPARRAVLGLLVLAGGEPVPRSALVDLLWGERPPPSAVNVLQTHVKHLRRLLEPDRPNRARSDLLPHVRGGYALPVDPARADLPRFRGLVAQANAAHRDGDVGRVARLLGEALELWHGPPLVDVPLLADHPTVVSLLAERRVALARYGDAMIELGTAAEVLPALVEAAVEQPLDEPAQARLIRAYHAVGERAKAFQTYQQVRHRLAEELGVDPGPELRAAHGALLRNDSDDSDDGNDSGAGTTGPGRGAATPAPAQLPPDVSGFTGRAAALAALDEMVSGTGPAVPIAAVCGAGGVGKTALAVHWSHRVRGRFADGQLYANLRGHAPMPAARPIEVLAQFLRALGVPAEQVPTELEAASALYRTMLADRRVLVVLDNVARPDQVRPLLPGSPGCLVLVTARDRMGGLVAMDGARQLSLDVLTPEEAAALLSTILGEQRVAAEPEAAGELAKLCVYLPLALRIAAANLADRPYRGVADHVQELREGNPLAALEVPGDEQAAVRTAFDLSYAALPDRTRLLFRLLGLVPGTDFGQEVAAALVDLPVAEAAQHLNRLADAHLVEQHTPGRFRFHDLLRRYAVEQTEEHDPPPVRQAATERLHEWYLHGVDRAAGLLYPHMLRLPVPAPRGLPVEAPFADRSAASNWLDAERGNLVATVRHASPAPAAWLLADSLRGYFWLCQYFLDWQAVAEAGLEAATTGGDERARAAARLSLADLYQRQSRYRPAVEHYAHALVLARRAEWSAGHAAVLGNLGCVYWQAGRLTPAVSHFDRALELSRRTGHTAGEAVTLGNLGLVHWERGELRRAALHCAQALELYRRIGSRYGEAINLGNLARIRHALGEDVTELLETTLALHREAGDRYGEAETRTQRARTLRDRGDLGAALDQARSALALASDIGDPRNQSEALHTLGTVEHRLGSVPDAVRHLREALDLARRSGDRYPECEALTALALACGDPEYAREALATARWAGYRVQEALALNAIAELSAAAGRGREAADYARKALEALRGTDHRVAGRQVSAVLTGHENR
ncbi:AfsR/SARP family transcriptional regulator [Actinophytocola xanthii]|uniref:AfsR family transcriptional regulator n=1 Tax=Actinophytocola xanthii TaxID=1912961 RepID=A0A1Q8CM94_9PSEU|nr:BTAD domain-containing putative transcriptional regulator [Actinophytocola xanthii]OLF15466.1 AfsR family transcriptional regulator [Actinophytocola xanthii]